MENASQTPHVVIIGGGFGGLEAAKAFAGKPVRVTLIDKSNHHLFQPLLYQVATAGLSPADIATPIRNILRWQKNARVMLGEVLRVDTPRKVVVLEDREVSYDYLIYAAGAVHSYFGHDEWSLYAPGLKTLPEATEIRRRILSAFEAAESTSHPEKIDEYLTFVVIGGGPTGVEMAGAIAEIARTAIPADFRNINTKFARIILIEAASRILLTFPEELATKAKESLEKLHVEVWTNCPVSTITADTVVAGGRTIKTKTVVWGAGVRASPLGATLGVALDRAGRIIANNDLSAPGHPEIFVVGDAAAVKQANGNLVPGVSPAAMQEGRHAAKNILRSMQGKERQPFEYLDKGNLATIGRAKAIADLGKIRLSGFIAWMAWLAVHIFFLIGFRNRVIVFTQWAWAYFTYQRHSRLITQPYEPFVVQQQKKKQLAAEHHS